MTNYSVRAIYYGQNKDILICFDVSLEEAKQIQQQEIKAGAKTCWIEDEDGNEIEA